MNSDMKVSNHRVNEEVFHFTNEFIDRSGSYASRERSDEDDENEDNFLALWLYGR